MNICPGQANGKFKEGQVFIKIKDSSEVTIQYNSNDSVPSENNILSKIIDKYNVLKFYHPFKLKSSKLEKIFVVTFIKDTEAEQLIRDLSYLPFIEYAERIPDYEVFFTPNDLHPNQWNLHKIQAQSAWDLNTGNSNIVVAIVDDAILLTHEDLVSNIWINPFEIAGNGIDDDANGYIDDINGWDVAGNDNNPNPPNTVTNSNFTHGTHVAGIVSAESNNNSGIASIGYSVSLMAIKTKSDSTTGSSLQAPYLGIEYAIAAGADIINMSWGGYYYSNTYQILLDQANDAGIILIAAAGNNNTPILMYPASYNHVISVGATDMIDEKSGFSNFGDSIDLMAPGEFIWSTLAGSNTSYGYLDGTSMACPLVSGLAGLMLSRNPLLTPEELENCLKLNCDNIDSLNPGFNGKLGAGRINAYETLICLKPINALFAPEFTNVCPGNSLTFTDQSNNNPISWQWYFQGGIPGSSNQENPVVTYNVPGVYDVTFIVSNTNGTDTLFKPSFIHVALPTATISGSDTIFSGYSPYLKIDLTGNPPWNISYTDGTDTMIINNITNTPYYFSVSPVSTTLYKLVFIQDAGCSGIVFDSALISLSTISLPCNYVKSYQYISTTSGNFTGILTNNGNFAGWNSVANIGDLDKDGINDLAVGECTANDGGWNRGALWILFLNQDGTVKSQQKISGTSGGFSGVLNNSSSFGSSVSGIGDLDGDGVNDIAVGAFRKNGGNLITGAVFILFLNTNGTVKSFQEISDVVGGFTDSLATDDRFGYDVSDIGDLDGDGITDLAIGCALVDDGGVDRGAVWICFMNSNGTVKFNQKISDTQGNFSGILDDEDWFGGAICPLGDLDGDGVKDIAVGVGRDDDGGYQKGAIWILFLNSNGTVKSYQKISSLLGGFTGNLSSISQLGNGVDFLGDIDGDGISDIITGTERDNDGGTSRGALWVLFLNADGTIKSHQKISDMDGNFSGVLSDNDYFGKSVSYIGDINGDGGADIAAGVNDPQTGALYILNLQSCFPPPCNLDGDFVFDVACTGDSTAFSDKSFDANSSSDIIVWKWFFGDGDSLIGVQNPQHIYLTADTFSVTLIVSDNAASPCFDTVTQNVIVVDNLSISAGADTSICIGDSVPLKILSISCGQPPFSYHWTPSFFLSDSTAPEPKASPPVSTMFYIAVSDNQSLPEFDSIMIYVDTTCCVSQAGIGFSNTLICFGDSIYLGNNSVAKPGAAYFWEFGSNANPTGFSGLIPSPVIFDEAGVFNIRLIVNDSCGSDTTNLNISVFPPPFSNVGNDTVICEGDTLQIGGLPISEHAYVWFPSDCLSDSLISNPFVFPKSAITYVIHVTDDVTGCSVSDSISISVNSLTLSLLSQDTQDGLCTGSINAVPNGGTAPYTFFWNDSLNQTTQNASGLCEGIFSVLVQDVFGCEVIGSDTINSISSDGVKPANSFFRFYPNPGKNEFTFELTDFSILPFQVIVYDNIGNTIKRQDFIEQELKPAFYLGEVAKGVYFIRISSKYGIINIPFVSE